MVAHVRYHHHLPKVMDEGVRRFSYKGHEIRQGTVVSKLLPMPVELSWSSVGHDESKTRSAATGEIVISKFIKERSDGEFFKGLTQRVETS